jgi:DNA repair photolyase
MIEIRKHRREVKTVLRKRDLVDSYFVGKFSFSPYHACAHGCLYCDGRAERYFVEGEFDRDIVVRTNAAALLDAEIAKLRERGIVFIGSGVSDAYQPPEREERLMEECARVMVHRSMPVTLLTKSTLVLRDLDLWCELNRKAGFLLMISVMTTDDWLRSCFEPHASPIEERLDVLTRFKERGIPVGVAAMPLLPYLSDSDPDLAAFAERLARTGVDFVLFGGLTLRPGRQKEIYLETIRQSFPDLLPRYERLYSENRASGAPLPAYMRDLNRRAGAALRAAGLPTIVPHRLYRGRLPRYDEIDVLLQQMLLLYADQQASVRRLRPAIERYRGWLQGRKSAFNRRRKLQGSDIEGELRTLAEGRGLSLLLENEKLTAFLRQVIVEGRILDPLTRTLI